MFQENRMKIISSIRNLIDKSILNKLIISFVVIILLPILIISYFSYNKLVDSIKSSYNRDNIEILRSLDKNLQIYMQDFNRITYNAFLSNKIQSILTSNNSDMGQRLDNQWAFEDFALSVLGDHEDIEGVYLVCSDKYIYFKSSYNEILYDYDLTKDEWYKKIENGNGKFVLIGSHKITYKKYPQFNYVFTVAREIMDLNSGRKIGTFFINIKPDLFYKLYNNINKNERDLVIVDGEGKIVFDWNESFIMHDFSEAYPGLDFRSRNREINSEKLGKVYLLYSHSDELNLMFVEIVPVKELLSQINTNTTPVLLVAFLSFIVFLLVAFYISRNIAMPLKLMENSMSKVEKGDFTQKVEINTHDEIGNFASRFNRMVEKIQELIVKVYETQLKKMESDFKALQAQINPHFLYNTLESINCLAEIKDEKEISEMVRGLGKMFRYSIRNDKEFVTLKDELDHVKNYILLQAVRYEDRFKIVYDIPKELMEINVLKLILQPLVENAIYHGLEKVSRKGLIRISASLDMDRLKIQVSDNGRGMEKEKIEEINRQLENNIDDLPGSDYNGRSIGIFNINSRIKLHFGSKYGLMLEGENDNGIVVTMIHYIKKGGSHHV